MEDEGHGGLFNLVAVLVILAVVVSIVSIVPSAYTSVASATSYLTSRGYIVSADNNLNGNLYVAASNAPDLDKARAQYVCTGTNDQNVINQAIQATQSTVSGHIQGGTVLLSPGTFNISDAISLTGCYRVTLMGSGWGFWEGWIPGNPGGGYEGYGISKIKQTVSGKNGITIEYANPLPQPALRSQGITISNLYLYGYNKTAEGIYIVDGSDQPHINNVCVHNWYDGMWIYNADTAVISNCTAMDNGGSGIALVDGGAGGILCYEQTVTGCCIYDNVGNGVEVFAKFAHITNNTIGRNAKGINLVAALGGHIVSNNTLKDNRTNQIYVSSPYCSITGNVLEEADLNTSVILFDAGAVKCTFVGNTLNDASATSHPTNMVLIASGANYNYIQGNTFNGSPSNTIVDGGTGNVAVKAQNPGA
jgi:parallel beta-helix repeat protein